MDEQEVIAKTTIAEIAEIGILITSPITARRETDVGILQKMVKDNWDGCVQAATRLRRLRAKLKQCVDLLLESKRHHYHCDDSWFCCAQCDHEDHVLPAGAVIGPHEQRPATCRCGADAWNAKVDALLGLSNAATHRQ